MKILVNKTEPVLLLADLSNRDFWFIDYNQFMRFGSEKSKVTSRRVMKNNPKHIPGIMSPIPLECQHVFGDEWNNENYRLHQCINCGYLEAHGPGGWSEVP